MFVRVTVGFITVFFLATLLAMPVQQRKKSLAFKLVRLPSNASGWSDGMEWEQPLHKNKTASLSEVTDGDVIVSRWNDSSVNKTGNLCYSNVHKYVICVITMSIKI